MLALKNFDTVEHGLEEFFSSIRIPCVPGKYSPCIDGVTPLGRKLGLGFSCFSLRSFYMLGWWDKLQYSERQAWISYINSFSTVETRVGMNNPTPGISTSGYVDEPLIRYISGRLPQAWLCDPRKQVQRKIDDFRDYLIKRPRYAQRVILAETKQAISTLSDVGQQTGSPYDGIPFVQSSLRQLLQSFDWSRPWEAGGQAAAYAVLLTTEGPRLVGGEKVRQLRETCIAFLTSLADRKTGGYYLGKFPSHQNLINGSMKVLSALDWLECPIHYPDRLIDTTLSKTPQSEGCDLVDAIYVLYRCCQQSSYRRRDVINFALELAKRIELHRRADGGFSYYEQKAQNVYYGAPISRGLHESDIHGSFLLVWALSMIFRICDYSPSGRQWNIIRP